MSNICLAMDIFISTDNKEVERKSEVMRKGRDEPGFTLRYYNLSKDLNGRHRCSFKIYRKYPQYYDAFL